MQGHTVQTLFELAKGDGAQQSPASGVSAGQQTIGHYIDSASPCDCTHALHSMDALCRIVETNFLYHTLIVFQLVPDFASFTL